MHWLNICSDQPLTPSEVGVVKEDDGEGEDGEGGKAKVENEERRDDEYCDASSNCYVINDLV